MTVEQYLLLMALSCPGPILDSDDVLRFPPPDVVQQQLLFNDGFRAHLLEEMRLQPHRRADLATAYQECMEPFWAWCYLQVERAERRGRWLSNLRDAIGPEAYARGEMPPVVPLHLFKE